MVISPSRAALVTLFFGLCVSPDAAHAEPISFAYQVEITNVCTIGQCLPFSARFPLLLSFDAAVTLAIDQPEKMERRYGLPNFSAVPLPRPAILPGAIEFSQTVESAVLLPQGDWRRVAGVSQVSSLMTTDTLYHWRLDLFKAADAFPTTVSAASFGSFLNGAHFNYAFFGQRRHEQGVFTPDSIGYSGRIVQDPTPVPEPASLLLLASGLGALGIKRWRRGAPWR